MAAMPTGSPMEAWEDGYVDGWHHAIDMAIAIVKDYSQETKEDNR